MHIGRLAYLGILVCSPIEACSVIDPIQGSQHLPLQGFPFGNPYVRLQPLHRIESETAEKNVTSG